MQAKTKTEPYDFFDPVYDGSYEVPIDTEYNLPDYCADVQRILKCRAVPEISSYIAVDDTITCDGICDIRIMYLDSTGDSIKYCDLTKEFTAVIKSKPSEENKAVAYVKAAVEHMTCRAVSARRIDVHMALSLKVAAVVQKNEVITVEIEDESIEKKTSTVETSQAVNAICHQFVIEDYLPLKNGKPPIDCILRRDVCSRIVDYKVEDERINVNGTTEISFLYSSAVDGSIEKMTSSIDFSQIIDCSGADIDCICDIKITTGESSIQPKEDNVGENTGVNVFTKIFIVACLYRPCEISVIDDAYSVAHPVELNYSQTNFMKIYSTETETMKNKCALVVNGEEIQKVLDIWYEQDEVNAYCDKEKVNYKLKFNICLLFINANGRIIYTEKPFDFNSTSELRDKSIKKCDAQAYSSIWEYRITDKNTVEVSVDSTVNSMFYTRFSVNQLTSAFTDESKMISNSGSKLLVYYATKGESLWSIAKDHKALISDIRAQNELIENEITTTGPIIICNR